MLSSLVSVPTHTPPFFPCLCLLFVSLSLFHAFSARSLFSRHPREGLAPGQAVAVFQ